MNLVSFADYCFSKTVTYKVSGKESKFLNENGQCLANVSKPRRYFILNLAFYITHIRDGNLLFSLYICIIDIQLTYTSSMLTPYAYRSMLTG